MNTRKEMLSKVKRTVSASMVYLTVIPRNRVVHELIADEARSAELAMSSCTTRLSGITVLLYMHPLVFEQL